MFKTEPHLHLSEISPCGWLCADEMIGLYHNAGFSTVFISDHLKKSTFDHLGEIPWQEKTAWFISGYEKAKLAGQKYGMNVILSAELKLSENNNHYLLYGIDKSFLDRSEHMFDMSIEDFYCYAKKNGVTVVQAHPMRDGRDKPCPESVDAFEVHNANPRHENFDEQVIEIAEKYGLPMTAGSDSHRTEDVARTGIETKYEIKTADDYIRALMKRELEIIYGGEK